MPRPLKRRRNRLVRRFLVVSLTTMGGVATVLILLTNWIVQQQALRDATNSAQAVAVATIQNVPADAFATARFDAELPERLRAQIHAYDSDTLALRLWTPTGDLLFDSSGADTGFPDFTRLDQAILSSEPSAAFTTEVRGGTTITAQERVSAVDVYVPIRLDGAVVGAAEVALDFTATQADLNATRQLVLISVASGMAVLWIVLFGTVRSAGQNLEKTARDNARQALQDSLTGLPNRRALTERLDDVVREALERNQQLGLMLLDVDRFKEINDSLGHDAGDLLLAQVARRLRTTLRTEDVVARLGGDEFAIMLANLPDEAAAQAAGRRVRAAFADPFDLGELPVKIDTSIGVAILPQHATDAGELMRLADVAMYTAKNRRSGVTVYSKESDDSSPARLVLVADMHNAVAAGELVMHYQPRIDLRTESVVGYEALIRWEHPQRGLIQPNIFIPLAEQTGVIHDLTRAALRMAVEQIAAWAHDGMEPLPVAVNLSALDVTDETIVDDIETLLLEHNVPTRLLEIEVTETAVVKDTSRILPVLKRLRAAGISVAIDDFGTGQTGLGQMNSWPATTIKIDREFIKDLDADRSSRQFKLVRAMVEMAHAHDLQIVAEGVETADASDTLRDLGVEFGQGYLWARPMPAADVALTAALAPA